MCWTSVQGPAWRVEGGEGKMRLQKRAEDGRPSPRVCWGVGINPVRAWSAFCAQSTSEAGSRPPGCRKNWKQRHL